MIGPLSRLARANLACPSTALGQIAATAPGSRSASNCWACASPGVPTRGRHAVAAMAHDLAKTRSGDILSVWHAPTRDR